jgi:drug/metabolite transporter (DMT)-like permease
LLTSSSFAQLGIIVGLLSTSVQSLGLTLQRKSHILEDEKSPNDVRRPPHRRRRWQLGMGMFILANVLGSTVQISMLPLPVLSTLQASGLVFNSICATVILGEPFTRWSLWGTLLVCSGATLIAIFGAIPSPSHKLSDLLELLGRRPFVLWMSFQAVLVVAIALATDLTSYLKKTAQSARFRLVRGLLYGCISGILSAHSLLVAKSAVELLLRTISDRDNQFVHWQSWMLVIALITLALSQLYYLHRGLKLVSTSVLYPLVFCIYNIIAILDGLIYFDQTNLITPLHACLITLGTVILLAGVLALSWRLHDEQHPPGVGQSSLAPGLGLVEDTDGEEEEEELLLASDIDNDQDDNIGQRQYSYNTFGPATPVPNGAAGEQERPSFGSSRKKSATVSVKTNATRWSLAETAEIWGELEDRDAPESPLLTTTHRQRSSTLPGIQGNASSPTTTPFPPFLGGRRATVNVADTAGASVDSAAPGGRRTAFRRRRKSTGFPGFQARKTAKRTSSVSATGLPETLGGLWRFRWWQSMKRKGQTADPEHGPGHGQWSVGPYRDLTTGAEDADADADAPPTRPLLSEGSQPLHSSGSAGSHDRRRPDRGNDTPG